MSGSKFTLIELLVVVAIIGILASMLLPSLAKAHEKGKTAVCVNNLKGIGITTSMYLSDFNDTFLSESQYFDGRQYYNNSTFVKETYGNYQVGYDSLYLQSKEVFRCPASRKTNSSHSFSYDYAMNRYLYNYKAGAVPNPVEVTFSTDTNYEWMQDNQPQRNDVRHGKNMVFLWLDGHVSIQHYLSYKNNLQWLKFTLSGQVSWTGSFTLN